MLLKPIKAGGGDQFDPALLVVFPKMYLPKKV